MKYPALTQSGQTLIMLLIFMLLMVTITGAAATITIVNTQATMSYASGETALQAAESGVECALIELERNPNYAGGSIAVGTGTATITIIGTGPKTLKSEGHVGEFRRTVTATVTQTNNLVSVTNWSETP